MKIAYRPIGTVHTPFKSADGKPVPAPRSQNAPGTVVVDERYTAALADLDGFSHVVLVCHLHLARPFSPKVVPLRDDVPRGLFATRAPGRPNPIGVSVVRLEKIDGAVLHVLGVDLIDVRGRRAIVDVGAKAVAVDIVFRIGRAWVTGVADEITVRIQLI